MKSEANGITEVINAIRTLTGVGICYYDLNAFFQYDKYGVKNNRGHYCAFCEKARSLPGGRKNCDQSDKFEAVELAKEYKTPFFLLIINFYYFIVNQFFINLYDST